MVRDCTYSSEGAKTLASSTSPNAYDWEQQKVADAEVL
jgi:hypothetical protein